MSQCALSLGLLTEDLTPFIGKPSQRKPILCYLAVVCSFSSVFAARIHREVGGAEGPHPMTHTSLHLNQGSIRFFRTKLRPPPMCPEHSLFRPDFML